MKTNYLFRFEARSSLKKFNKINGYQADSTSQFAFVRHLHFKFKFSEFELNQAIRENKIRVITLAVLDTPLEARKGDQVIYED